MQKRGRPKSSYQKSWMLARAVLALYAYGRARDAGEKHSVAITEAVNYIRTICPRMKVSETEVKRILAVWRSIRRAACLVVSKPDAQHSMIPLPRGGTGRKLYTVSVRLRRTYPRANAAEKPKQRCNSGR
jgi:hypothetical protein